MRAYLLMIAVSAIVTFLATHLVIKITRKYKIYPEIRSRDSHSEPTPRLGGLGMFAGFLVAMGTAASLGWFKSVFVADGPIMGVLIAASIIAILGALDDVYDLDWMLKLGGQFVAAGILAWNGVQIVSLPIGGITIGSFGMSFTVSVFLTVLIMNAVNFIDGLDGLVAGVVLIGTSTFFVYSYLLAQKTTPSNYFSLASLISAIVIGMCLGFLPHNWRPAKIFMGDSGALLLALLMTTSAVSVTGQLDPAFIAQSNLMPAFLPMIIPLAILVLPLLDFTLAVLRRLRAGKSPFAADRQHLHHRLQDFGHGHLGSVIVFYVWTTLISATCLLLFLEPAEWAIAFGSIGTVLALIYTVWPVLIRKLQERKAGN
jgi:UDP-GlcNAc:undecaprenyl-phosphate GlcNAc-1-phosphate transferase